MANSTNNKNKEFSSIPSSLSNYEKIIDLLNKNNSGLTIAEISRLLNITRNTATVYLARLEGAEQVEIRKIGMAKLYSLKPKQTNLTIKEEV